MAARAERLVLQSQWQRLEVVELFGSPDGVTDGPYPKVELFTTAEILESGLATGCQWPWLVLERHGPACDRIQVWSSRAVVVHHV